jgi:glycosyltransferase involved in cell wall biosynthesis
VPAFNAGRWIAEALDSALSQTYRTIEVIVAENRSTDNTREVVTRFKKAVRVIDAPIHGCGAARNAGLADARGEVIQWLDADDVLEPWKIERQLDRLLESDADIVWGPFWTYELAHGSTVFERRIRRVPAIGTDVVAGLLSGDGWVQMGAILMRRGGPFESLRFEADHRVEDINYLIRGAFAGAKFVKSEGDSGLLFRQHGSPRASSVPNRFLALASADNARLALRLWTERGELTPRRRDAVVDVFIFAARSLFDVDRESFTNVLNELRCLDPGFVRRLPPKLRIASKIVGYRRAEEIATRSRGAARILRRVLK